MKCTYCSDTGMIHSQWEEPHPCTHCRALLPSFRPLPFRDQEELLLELDRLAYHNPTLHAIMQHTEANHFPPETKWAFIAYVLTKALDEVSEARLTEYLEKLPPVYVIVTEDRMQELRLQYNDPALKIIPPGVPQNAPESGTTP